LLNTAILPLQQHGNILTYSICFLDWLQMVSQRETVFSKKFHWQYILFCRTANERLNKMCLRKQLHDLAKHTFNPHRRC